MTILYIDTTNKDEVILELEVNGEKFSKKNKILQNKKEVALNLVSSFLKEHKLTPQDLTEIKVNPGPGSFTGIRVGVSIANAMGFSLKIPVNGKIGQSVLPVYT
ncbi:MAG TPA: tRNA (adenosine(37)-N6)-threonylcarbamoyltransferase complex dimerization subunit type 1 TsaB [Patescibacteria group bacterium]|nr:tRNA (adenosine(37)-N6)-threonylcarbamoyltransferase complex dimerization subunit type 1 TsaB [Patescibacteria group bacterium]